MTTTYKFADVSGIGETTIDLGKAKARLREILSAVGVKFDPNGKKDLCVNGRVTKNLDQEVEAGSLVSLNPNVAAG